MYISNPIFLYFLYYEQSIRCIVFVNKIYFLVILWYREPTFFVISGMVIMLFFKLRCGLSILHIIHVLYILTPYFGISLGMSNLFSVSFLVYTIQLLFSCDMYTPFCILSMERHKAEGLTFLTFLMQISFSVDICIWYLSLSLSLTLSLSLPLCLYVSVPL